MFGRKSTKQADGYASYYSRRGDHATIRMAQAIARKSWRWTLLNLAWTAGPVTFLAIYIGHRMGFGDGPSTSQFIYFGFYTLVVGLCAVLATILHEALYQPKIDQEKKRLLQAVDRCFSFLLHARDLHLASLAPKERKLMAAYYTLQSAGCSSNAFHQAVFDLTDNIDLADAVLRISAFDEQGMQSLVDDVLLEHESALEGVKKELKQVAPAACDLLDRWMKGNSPDYSSGRLRDQGFIQRTIDAAEDDDLHLMTLSDAYEMASLAFELLNGREISVLELRFSGSQIILREKKRLDVATRKYRQAVQARNNSIRVLLLDIDKKGSIDRLAEATLPTSSMLVGTLIEDLQMFSSNERKVWKEEYQKIRKQHQKVISRRQEVITQKQKYLTTVRHRGEKLSLVLNENDLSRAGFYINQGSISLGDDQKILLAHMLDESIGDTSRSLSPEKTKEIAMLIAMELDRHIQLERFDRQAAIESSYALQAGFLQRNYTPATKVGWARRVLQGMHENQQRAAHRLARNLVAFYGIHLSRSVIELLVSTFGADEAYLRSLNAVQRTQMRPETQLMPEPQDMPVWEQL